jgi:uncharacterized protein YceK
VALAALLLSGCAGVLPSAQGNPGGPAPTSEVAGARSTEQGQSWNFDGGAVGGLPTGATTFSGNWAVRAESDAPSQPNALCQTGTSAYPALALTDTAYEDVVITIRFKPISGNTDRAAGIIFRVQDKDNYYTLRASALENNVTFYKYSGGRRNLMKGGSATVASGQWQMLRLEVSGSRFRGYLNNQLVVDANDDSFKTGGIGLWTKSDSVACFDNVEVRAQ